jgi:hypothetical protein
MLKVVSECTMILAAGLGSGLATLFSLILTSTVAGPINELKI